ncbi:MAG: hypothetical protein KME07_21425 [Pegethrix bostrychoides GSE-TBD4-15B]|jgi:hypothetical protein|uniref:Uncharacterized protein n=1 Tax=Pegethrix bostrychoides GSE-TBD4-15B TaxID=2839662 RepID=A0A951PEZ9_9CYAN|nr:hypothetical protein [Pegethrix bostrychoides GSE-TBD4-15B]
MSLPDPVHFAKSLSLTSDRIMEIQRDLRRWLDLHPDALEAAETVKSLGLRLSALANNENNELDAFLSAHSPVSLSDLHGAQVRYVIAHWITDLLLFHCALSYREVDP